MASGIAGQVLVNLAKLIPSDQDHLPITDRTSRQWIRVKPALDAEKQGAAVAFFMDGYPPLLPLTHSRNYADDPSVGACASLDVAMRFFDDEIDFNQWHLQELRAVAAGSEERTRSRGCGMRRGSWWLL